MPNDLLINGSKVCGILQETIVHNERKFIVIGIGLNINNNPNIKNYPTTSINEYSDKKLKRSKVFTNIRKTFEKRISKF